MFASTSRRQQPQHQALLEKAEHQARIGVALEARASFRRAFGRPFDQHQQHQHHRQQLLQQPAAVLQGTFGAESVTALSASDMTMSSVFASSSTGRRESLAPAVSATNPMSPTANAFGIRALVESFAALEYSLRQEALRDMAASQGAVSEVELTEHRVKSRMQTMVAGMLMDEEGRREGEVDEAARRVAQGSPVSAARSRRSRSWQSSSDFGLQLSPRSVEVLHEVTREPTLAELDEASIQRRRAADDDDIIRPSGGGRGARRAVSSSSPQPLPPRQPVEEDDEPPSQGAIRPSPGGARRADAASRMLRRRCADLCAVEAGARSALLATASATGGPFWAVTHCVEASERIVRASIEEEALLAFALTVWHGVNDDDESAMEVVPRGGGLAWLHYRASLDGAQHAGERLRAAEAYHRATQISEEAAARRELRRLLVAGPGIDYLAQRRWQDELDRATADARYARRLELERQRDDRALDTVVERQRELAAHQRGAVEVRRRVRDELRFLVASEEHPRATIVEEEEESYPYDAVRVGIERLEESVRIDAVAALTLEFHHAFGSLLLLRMCAEVLDSFAPSWRAGKPPLPMKLWRPSWQLGARWTPRPPAASPGMPTRSSTPMCVCERAWRLARNVSRQWRPTSLLPAPARRLSEPKQRRHRPRAPTTTSNVSSGCQRRQNG